MLQKLRDRSNIERYVERISRIEREGRELFSKLLGYVEGFRGDVIVAYHRHGYLPASITYWFLSTMDPDRRVLFNEVNAITYYILPYREKCSLLLYTSNPYTASVINALQTARVMGYESVVVSLEPRDERVKNIYSRYNRVFISREDELEATLTMSILAYYVFSNLYRDRLGVRGKHLYQHVEEGLAPVVEELIDKYVDQLQGILQRREVVVTSSKMLEPVAMFLVEVLRRLKISANYQVPEQVTGSSYVVLLSTSVEEYLARELMFKYGVMNNRVENLIMNTDPLEAQIYFATLFYYLVTLTG